MQETSWEVIPFPYYQFATPFPPPPRETRDILHRLLEDATALAGVLAAAAQSPEVDEHDIGPVTLTLR